MALLQSEKETESNICDVKPVIAASLSKDHRIPAINNSDAIEKSDIETLINTTNDLFWSVSTEFKLIVANNAFIRDLEDAVCMTVDPGDDLLMKGIFPEGLVSFWRSCYDKALEGYTFKKEIYAPAFNKRKASWRETTFNPIYKGGRITGIACFSRNITERKLAEEKLRKSETHLAEAQQLAKLGSWNFDVMHDRLTWSDELYHIFGIDKKNATETHHSFTELIDEKDRELVLRTSKHTQETGESFTIEYNITTPKGEKLVIQEHGYGEIGLDGKVNRLFGTAQDITERKRAEKKLMESEEKYRNLFEQNVVGVYQTTLGGRIISCNSAFAKMLKYDSPAELLKINASGLYFSDADRNHLTSKVTTLKNITHYESVLKCKDGSPLYFTENVSLGKDDFTGELLLNGIMIDITEKKQAELELKESNKRYNLICKATNDMVWDWDLVTGKVYRNKEGWKKIFRTSDREIENELMEDWDKRIHPEDRNKVKQVTREIESSLNDFFEVECRMLRDDGTYGYIHDKANIIRNDQGRPIRLIGATQDITERKVAELQLAKSELRFRSLVQNSSELICIFNERGYFKYSSPAIKHMLGFEPENTIEKNAFAFVHPDDIMPLKDYLGNMKSTGYQKMPLLRFKNTGGEWRWIESKVTDMSENPEVAGYVFNCRDVTERISLEKELETEKLLKHQEITKAVISAQEQERQELGGELHDNVNQILAGSLLYLGLAKKELNIDHPYLKEADTLINNAIEEIRNLSHSLIQPSLHESEFLDALKNIIESTQKSSGIFISLQACGFDESSIPDKLKLTIYRIVQEQLNNILKHAAARKVIIHLVKVDEKTMLSIKDDGVGFDTTKKATGVGLMNIKTRASLFNGDLSLVSSPGKGCELKVLFN